MKVKGIFGIILISALLTGMFAGCGSTKLSEAFDETEVTEAAESVIDQLNTGDYEGAVSHFDSAMAEAVPAATLEESLSPTLEAAGAFQEYKSVAVIGQKIKDKETDTEADSATAVVVAQYENKKHTFTVTYNTEMEISGLYMK